MEIYKEGVWSFFSSFVSYEVGDEIKIRFWHNLWVGTSP